MTFLSDTLVWLLQLIGQIMSLYAILILVVVIMSWLNPDPWNPIVRTLRALTDPVLDLFRRFIPVVAGLDLSPWAVILVISFVRAVLIPHLVVAATRLAQS